MPPLTRSYYESVRERCLIDPGYREGILRDSVESLLSGEPGVGLIGLSHAIYGGMGFEFLSTLLDMSPEGLKELLTPTGGISAMTLFEIIERLMDYEGVEFEIASVSRRYVDGPIEDSHSMTLEPQAVVSDPYEAEASVAPGD